MPAWRCAGKQTLVKNCGRNGWAVTAYLWRHNIVPLAQAGYRVFAPDLPGHGLSGVPAGRGAYSLEHSTDRLTLLLDALALSEVSVAAQSMGGRIAFELARRAPERLRCLALFGPVGFGDLPPQKVFAPFVPLLPGPLPSMLVTRRAVELVQRRVHGKVAGGGFSERDVDEYWAPSQFPDVVRAQLQMLREFDWAPLAPETVASVTVRTLVVFGTLDRTVRPANAAALVARLPQGRLVWVEGGGHVVMEEVPDRINRLLTDFLAGA